MTALLRAWQAGDEKAGNLLVPLVYADLRRAARRQLRRAGPQATLNPTELAHESYLRLLGQTAAFENRVQFLALASTMMRRILVDRARRRAAARRGGRECHITLEWAHGAETPPPSVDMIALDRALQDLAAFDADQARLVELHFFGGLSFDEVATAMGTSPATVYREWRVARLWLLKRLSGGERASGAMASD